MSDRWVTVATFQEPVAAALAKNFLESAGIPAVLFDETTIATDWMLSAAIGGIKLQVAPLHLERAELLLTQIQDEKGDGRIEPIPATAIATQEIAESLRAEQAELDEDERAEQVEREPINQLTDKLFRSAVFSLIFCPFVLYTLYLLMEIAGSEGTISPERRWKLWVSLPLTLVPVLAVFLFVGPSWCVYGWM